MATGRLAAVSQYIGPALGDIFTYPREVVPSLRFLIWFDLERSPPNRRSGRFLIQSAFVLIYRSFVHSPFLPTGALRLVA